MDGEGGTMAVRIRSKDMYERAHSLTVLTELTDNCLREAGKTCGSPSHWRIKAPKERIEIYKAATPYQSSETPVKLKEARNILTVDIGRVTPESLSMARRQRAATFNEHTGAIPVSEMSEEEKIMERRSRSELYLLDPTVSSVNARLQIYSHPATEDMAILLSYLHPGTGEVMTRVRRKGSKTFVFDNTRDTTRYYPLEDGDVIVLGLQGQTALSYNVTSNKKAKRIIV